MRVPWPPITLPRAASDSNVAIENEPFYSDYVIVIIRASFVNKNTRSRSVQEVHMKNEVIHLTPGLLGLEVLCNFHA